MKIRFVGERPEDLGGPIRESLTLCMRTFQDLGFMVFNSIKSLCLTANTEAVLREIYYKLGEITALSILIIDRELECLQPAIVRFIFQVQKPEVIENIEDAFITYDLQEISKGNYDPLCDANIITIGASVADLQQTFVLPKIVLTKFSAIKQFVDGISSLCNNLTSTTFYKVISTYLRPKT